MTLLQLQRRLLLGPTGSSSSSRFEDFSLSFALILSFPSIFVSLWSERTLHVLSVQLIEQSMYTMGTSKTFLYAKPSTTQLVLQEIERHDPDLICLEEVNFGISRSNTSIQCPYSRWTASHSSGAIWTVWVLPGFGFQNLRRHVWSSRFFFVAKNQSFFYHPG